MESQSVQFWSAKALQRKQHEAEVQSAVQRLEGLLKEQYIRRQDLEQEKDADLSILWLLAAISDCRK